MYTKINKMFFLYLGFFNNKSIFGMDTYQQKKREVDTLLQDTRNRFEFLPVKKENCYNTPLCYTDYPYLNKLEVTINETVDNQQKYPISFLFDYSQICHHPDLPQLRQNFKNSMDNLLNNKDITNKKEAALKIFKELIKSYTSIIINNLIKNDGEFQYDNRGPKIQLSTNPEEKVKFKKIFFEDPFKIILPLDFKSLIGQVLECKEFTALNLFVDTLPLTKIYSIATSIGKNIHMEDLRGLDLLIMDPIRKYNTFINENIKNLMLVEGQKLGKGFLRNILEEWGNPQERYKINLDFQLDQQAMNETFLTKPLESVIILLFLDFATKIFPLVEFHINNPANMSLNRREEEEKIQIFRFILHTLQELKKEQYTKHTSLINLIKDLTNTTTNIEMEKVKSQIRIIGGFTQDNILLYTLFKMEVMESIAKHTFTKDQKIIEYKEFPLVDISIILQEFDMEIYIDPKKEGFFLIAPINPERFLAKIVQEQKKTEKQNKNILNKWVNNLLNMVEKVSKEPDESHLQAYTIVEPKETTKSFFSKFSSNNSNKIQQKDIGAFSPVHHIYAAPHVKGLHKKRTQTIHRDIIEFLSSYAQIEELIMDDVSRQEDILCFFSILGPSLKSVKMYINNSQDFKKMYKQYEDNENEGISHNLDEIEIVLDPTISDNDDSNLYSTIKVFADLGLKSAFLNNKSVNLYITLPLVTKEKFDKELKIWGANYHHHPSKDTSPNVVFYMDIYEFNVYEESNKSPIVNPNRTEISTNYGPVKVTYHQNLKNKINK